MTSSNHLGNRKVRRGNFRTPSLGYYLIITDTKETEKNYFHGLRDSLPENIKDKIVIKVINTKTDNLIQKATELRSKESQYQQIWIVFDKDLLVDFDTIIKSAIEHDMSVGWSNPCFEIWLHAYFNTMPNYENSVKCCSEFSKEFKKVVGKEYSKNSKTIYKDLLENGDEDIAIKLATAKLEDAKNKTNLPSKMFPATTIHLLIEEIKRKAR